MLVLEVESGGEILENLRKLFASKIKVILLLFLFSRIHMICYIHFTIKFTVYIILVYNWKEILYQLYLI